MDDPSTKRAHEFIAALDEINLSRYRVVGVYTRYDEAVRNALQDARQKILAGFELPGRKRENHLIWAAPGAGKTYFVQQVAASLPNEIRYHEINLAKCTEVEFRSALAGLEAPEPRLCLVDEIDAKPQEPWPYEVLLPYLDAAVERRDARFVFVLAGSSGASVDEIKDRIAARAKGTDLLSRIPTGHEYAIGPMSVGDRILIVLSQLRQAGRETGRQIRAIEKLGLYYVALNPRLANARQLREFAVRAVERVPKSDDRVKYDHLFLPGDPENKAFWMHASTLGEQLVNTFVILAGDRVLATPSRTCMAESAPAPVGFATPPPSIAIGTRPRTNLPRQLTSFIGRDREIAEVTRLLPTTGLMTLTGPGGCGKTRLAFRVAADLVTQYPDGAWVAELAALSDPALVPKAVATALDVPEQPGRPLTETLKDFLGPKSLLLVLDNCEHLVTACAELADTLLRMCSTLRILATSREPLGLPGEIIWGVPSLSVPEPARLASPEHLAQFEAVRLFVERAANSQPGFALTGRNATAIAQVCTQLDGIPLAIEFAAARVRVLSVDQIAARLDDRFRLLTAGPRKTLPRHQTLRAALDWSYDLLSEQERTVFRWMSVFVGGCTLEAAEAVCAGAGVAAADILDLLTQLVDKSLIFVDTKTQARYLQLETIRRYAWEALVRGQETTAARASHRDFFFALAEDAERYQGNVDEPRWLDRLEDEHGNLRAALAWCLEAEQGDIGVRLAAALGWFWSLRGHLSEGRDWLTRVLEAGTPASAYRARALCAASQLALDQGDLIESNTLGEEALARYRGTNDRAGVARTMYTLGVAAVIRQDYVRAAELFDSSLQLSRELQYEWGIAAALRQLGQVALWRREYGRASEFLEESFRLYRKIGNRRGVALSLHYLGGLAYFQGDKRAPSLLDDARSSFLQLGDPQGAALSGLWLANVLHTQGDNEHARALYRESLVASRDLKDDSTTLGCLYGMAFLEAMSGSMERGARLLGAAETLRERIGSRPLIEHMIQREGRNLEMMRSDTFRKARTEGLAMTLEQAIEYALAVEEKE